jgi:hypothetical protein
LRWILKKAQSYFFLLALSGRQKAEHESFPALKRNVVRDEVAFAWEGWFLGAHNGSTATTGALLVTTAYKVPTVSNNLDLRTLCASFFVFPSAIAQTTINQNWGAFLEPLRKAFSQLAKENNIKKVSLITVTTRAIWNAFIYRDTSFRDVTARLSLSSFGIPGQVSHEDDFIKGGHELNSRVLGVEDANSFFFGLGR